MQFIKYKYLRFVALKVFFREMEPDVEISFRKTDVRVKKLTQVSQLNSNPTQEECKYQSVFRISKQPTCSFGSS